jgi:hypothetical protein
MRVSAGGMNGDEFCLGYSTNRFNCQGRSFGYGNMGILLDYSRWRQRGCIGQVVHEG